MNYTHIKHFGKGMTSLQGYVGQMITPDAIHSVFGKGLIYDGIESDDGKVRWEWSFEDENGNTFNIYDYKSNTGRYEPYDWHVGACAVDIKPFVAWFLDKINNTVPSALDAEEYDPEMKVVVGSMWDTSSSFYELHMELWRELVPDSGMSATMHGEALRCIARLYYDAYNNGGCNSTAEHFLYYVFYLMEWSDSQEGWSPVEALKSLKRRLRYAKHVEKQNTDYEHRYAGEGPYSWGALEDQEYLTALEEVVHWVTWKVNRINQ